MFVHVRNIIAGVRDILIRRSQDILISLIIVCYSLKKDGEGWVPKQLLHILSSGRHLTLSLLESIMETCSVVLSFESVDKILWCDHSNETSSAVLLYGTINFSIFYKTKFEIFLKFCYLALLGVQ